MALCFTRDSVCLAMKESDDMQGFSTLSTDTLFQEFFIESRADDQIAILANAQNLARALASGANATLVSLRLLTEARANKRSASN